MQRIPSLDGLRAISIAFVIMGHAAGTDGATYIPYEIAANMAEFGVRVFFVISGFLITSLLLEEHRTYGRISLGHFFLRRTFRIFPPFLAFLLGLWIASEQGWLTFSGRDWVHALTYTVNYHASRPWDIAHLWSLSVEEQFYLIWPALLVLAGIKRGMMCAAAMIAVAPLLRVTYLILLPNGSDYLGLTLDTAGDALAIGCLLGYLRNKLWTNEVWRVIVTSPVAIGTLFALAYVLHLSTKVELLAGAAVLNIAIAVVIERSIRMPHYDLGKLLNTSPMIYVGLISYSLYLWQQPFLNRYGTSEFNHFPLNLLMAIAACLFTYYVVERPALKLRQRIERWMKPRAGNERSDSDRARLLTDLPDTQAAEGVVRKTLRSRDQP